MRRRNEKIDPRISGFGMRLLTNSASLTNDIAAQDAATQEKFAEPPPMVYLREALKDGLMRSKTPYSMWGREVLRALEVDDAFRMLRVFADKPHLGAHFDAQTTHEGYGGYVWTPWIHKFLGDTLLHIAIKWKKMKCIGYLLYSGARTDIPNHEGLTAEAIAPTVGAKQCLNDLRRGSMREMLQTLPISDFDKIPDECTHRNVEAEAWRLMYEGRTVYSELPKCYSRAKPKFSSLREANSSAAVWTSNSAWDTIELVRRQAARARHVAHEKSHHRSGLRSEKVKTLQLTEQSDDLFHKYYKRLSQTPGFRHLRFAGWSLAQKEAQSGTRGEEVDGDDNSLAGRSHASAVGGLTLHNMEEKLPTRYITVISTFTNFKSVHLGPEETKELSSVLRHDPVVTDLILFSAHLSDSAVSILCKSLESMEVLMHLDLSHNAITDKSCDAIGKVIQQSRSLKKLNLRGNRISDDGAKGLTKEWSTSSTCRYLNLSKNRVSASVLEELRILYPRSSSNIIPDENHPHTTNISPDSEQSPAVTDAPTAPDPSPPEECGPGQGASAEEPAPESTAMSGNSNEGNIDMPSRDCTDVIDISNDRVLVL